MKNICVFCGSNIGASSEYIEVAKQLGTIMAQKGFDLIYGGANVGLMRATAEKVLEHKGKVTGVITHFLSKKHPTQNNITNLISVETMQERKVKMADLSDGFIALPGGFGTLEELFEVLTAAQLGFHKKPIVIINTNGFYNYLKAHIKNMVSEKMVLQPHAAIAHFVDTPNEAFEVMEGG